MNEYDVIVAQIDALAENLGRAERALGAQQIDPDLREAVRIRFSKLISKQQKGLEKLREEVEGDLPLDECWYAFRYIRQECMPIFRECLAFLEGGLVRSAGIDDGICHVADALLDDLSYRADIYWARLTILAEGELFDQTAEIIRLRFPEFSIWNLPISGHEFGHLVGQELRVLKPDGTYRYPIQEILQIEGQTNPQNVPFLREHFADLFAVYALGPAFACPCILLRFDPGVAYKDGKDHPSYAKRVHFILEALRRMDEAEGMLQPYRDIIEYLSGLWQRNLLAAKQPESLDQATIVQLNDWLERLYVQIDTHLPPYVRYRGWSRAQRLSSELLSEKGAAQVLEDDDTLPDVLNAAWLCRIEQKDEDSYLVRRIGENAVELCREIIIRRPKAILRRG